MEHRNRTPRASSCRGLAPAAAVALTLAAVVAAPGRAVPALAADRPIIAVADFYSPGALPIAVVTDPEPYAADVLTGLLVRAGGNALTVLPRSEVRSGERSLGWRSQDALNFGRLGALAKALHADRVMLGLITRVSLYRQDVLAFSADVTVNMQMFDARQGRIVWQHETGGSGFGGVPDFAVQIAVERALAHGVGAAVAPASAAVERPAPQP